ncbi:hypothetical protein [Mesorhizobium sp. WSM2239]|uniref:Lysozyme n=2 Tax=unclassified Mesorhizobium TaxID=325217 RepID=A0AAU8D567_9HYPH
MFGLFDWIKLGAGFTAGALATGSAAYLVGYAEGDGAGYDRRVAEVAVADGKATLERKGDDATLQTLSDYDLCVVGMRGSGLPVDACEQLRPVREGEP